jgi:hypothetical protein
VTTRITVFAYLGWLKGNSVCVERGDTCATVLDWRGVPATGQRRDDKGEQHGAKQQARHSGIRRADGRSLL